MNKIIKQIGNKGETLLEVILSLGLFAMTIALVVTLIATSQRVFVRNLETQESFNTKINVIDSSKDVETVDDKKVKIYEGGIYSLMFDYSPKGKNADKSTGLCMYDVKLLSVENGILYRLEAVGDSGR